MMHRPFPLKFRRPSAGPAPSDSGVIAYGDTFGLVSSGVFGGRILHRYPMSKPIRIEGCNKRVPDEQVG
jgi:hypothetical protein